MRRPSRRPARVRFAASPAGLLHLGSARIAVAAALLAAQRGEAPMLLRLDDADPALAGQPGGEAIATDLAWLGLPVGETVRQSGRAAAYAAAAARLEALGRIYPCFESEEELRAKRDLRLRQGRAAIYDRAMLRLTPAQRQAAEAGGKRPYWRFRLSDGVAAWRDGVLGAQTVKLTALSDPVVIRADGVPLPVFASAVDDLDLGITETVRGAEHLASTGIELDIREALGGRADELGVAHLPVLTDAAGERLSRQAGNVTIRSLRQMGVEPASVRGMLARLGTGAAPAALDLPALAASFSLPALAREAPRFDLPALLSLNRQALRDLPFALASGRLPPDATEAFWLAIRGSVDTLAEARGWWDVVGGEIVPPVVGQEDGLRRALDLLPGEPWDATVLERWTRRIVEAEPAPKETLLPAIYLALTGEEDGPDLAALLPLMGRVRAARRLQMAAR